MTSKHLQEVPLGVHLSYAGYEPLYLPLSHLPCQRLVRSLALSLIALSEADGPINTPWTAKGYRNAISQFARWLRARKFTGDVPDITVANLYEFGRDRGPDIEGHLRALLRATVGNSQAVGPELVAHLEGLKVSESRRSQPLAPYSRGEHGRLVKACREEIAAWDAATTMTGPMRSVVLAFRILLGLELGIVATALTDLDVSGVRWQGDRDVRVEYIKNRARGAEAMTFRLRGPWSGPALLRRWLDLTGPMRANAPELANRFWLYADADGRVQPAQFSENDWRATRLTFLSSHQLRDDDGRPLALDLRRLRTTWVARKAKYWHGAVTVDPNHTATVEGDRYLTRSADPEEVAAIVEAAQGDLLRRAEHVALVTAADNHLADEVDGPAAVLAREAIAVDDRTEWDMFAAACKNPFDSPFTAKGSFCVAAVWSCLVCPLAVITPAKLPALLRLHDFLEERRTQVTLREWLAAFAPAWVQLTTRILPRFDDVTLAAARSAVDSDEDLPMPIDPLWAS